MVMSIDKAISHGQEQLEIFGGEHKEFIESAIDIMCKYKKIENIVSEVHEGYITKYQKIEEVLKDGNDN